MAPLVSILLPTRNRLELLVDAIETVRRQDDGDWEIVVSDNDSEQDIAGHVAALGDERVRYVRTGSSVPATENWNHALAQATGRYILMLGDDDGLVPGYVARLRELVERFDDPDVVHTGAWLFAHPDVFPEEPGGYLQLYSYSTFMRGRTEPFLLDPRVARKVVRQAMRFRLLYAFNPQFSVISRRLIDELAPRGAFYQSPFPDYYATNVAFLTARRIAVDPRPMVVIGITRKSFGFFALNAQEDAGKAFLGDVVDEQARERLEAAMLPGSHINAGWLASMESIWARYADLAPAPPDHRRFRLVQAVHAYEGHYLNDSISAQQLTELEQHLRGWERRLGRAIAQVARRASRGRRPLPRRARWVISWALHWIFVRQFPAWDSPKERDRHRTLIDVYDALEPAKLSSR